MGELANCSRCNNVFVKTLRDICQQCYREEEEAFETVYRFLSQRKNREATLMEIVEATGVEEELVIKFIKEKRLRTSQFPKLAYPCEKRSEEHTSELQSRFDLVCRLLLETKNKKDITHF